jgi:hypothetical protein
MNYPEALIKYETLHIQLKYQVSNNKVSLTEISAKNTLSFHQFSISECQLLITHHELIELI